MHVCVQKKNARSMIIDNLKLYKAKVTKREKVCIRGGHICRHCELRLRSKYVYKNHMEGPPS